MPIDSALYRSPAIRGDISGTAITTAIALNAIADALEAITLGRNDAVAIAKIRDQANKLDKIFDDLTGYTNESR